jgi:hypothetical protein
VKNSLVPNRVNRTPSALIGGVLVAVIACFGLPRALACPFCDAVGRTFTEQMDSFDVAVIAKMETEPSSPDDYRLPTAKFTIVEFLRGAEYFPEELGLSKEFENIVADKNSKVGDLFFVMGAGTRHVNWTSPIQVSDKVIAYLKEVVKLPEGGAERLEFFAARLENAEATIAADAFDEFARASYEEVLALGPRLDREKLIGWLKDPDVIVSRKRLYYTLLGTCGKPEDIAWLEEVIRSGDKQRQAGLDALVACYLTLSGDAGMPLVEEVFLKNPQTEQLELFSIIQAIRFHGTESDKVSRDKLVQAIRLVLDRPQMADMVIPDLARWQDWSVMDRLVVMFREATTEDTRWIRTPIISYLFECPLEQADKYVEELRAIDPDAVERAEMLANIEYADDSEGDDDWDDEPGAGKGTAETDPNPDQPRPLDNVDPESGKKDGGGNPAGNDESGSNDSTGDGDGGHGGAENPVVVLRPALPDPPGTSEYVSTRSAIVSDMGNGEYNEPDGATDSIVSPVGPVATVSGGTTGAWQILAVTIGVCLLISGLLISVFNGWFEKLIV